MGRAPGLHVRAHTWLSDDMLRDDQTPLIDDGTPGNRLGDDWLLPAPLRLTAVDNAGRAMIATWALGCPEHWPHREGMRDGATYRGPFVREWCVGC